MKLSSIILLVTFSILVVAMFASNVLLKKEYYKMDKSDLFWNYGKILQQPFKHLKIEGGNFTNIAFEQSNISSVKVFKNWIGYENKVVKAMVTNDTLFIKFSYSTNDLNEREYLRRSTMVRIFSPELLSVDGYNTNFELFKLKQRSISINLSGRSKLEVESYINHLDSLHISQKDSSEVVFEISPDLKGKKMEGSDTLVPNVTRNSRQQTTGSNNQRIFPGHDVPIKSWETIYIRTVDASIQGASILDLGHAQINSLKINVSDTSAIILSGQSLGKYKK
jgi:hypothetical protein